MNDKQTKTRVLDDAATAMGAGNHEAKGPRFLPSGLTHLKYQGTRIRRFQMNQSSAVVAGLEALDVYTTQQLVDRIESDPVLANKAVKYLQSCLVGPEKRSGAAKLFRPGTSGTSKMVQELRQADVARALCLACDQVGILQNPPEPEDGSDGGDSGSGGEGHVTDPSEPIDVNETDEVPV